MQAVIYARVSSREQAEEGHYSLAAQERLLQTYAEQHGYSIVKVFAVPESASGTKERKTFAEMVAFVKQKKIHHVLCEKTDRLTRNRKEAVMIDDWLEKHPDNKLHLVKQNLVIHQNSKSHEKFQWDIYIAVARQYSNNLREEVRKGQDEGARQGIYPGPSKLGYISWGKHGLSPEGRPRRPDPKEAPKIQEVFQRIAGGEATYDVLKWARETAKLKNTNGTVISRSRFYEMIRDQFYCGSYIWRGKHHPGKHKAIVSEKLFHIVQEILDGKRNIKSREFRYLFKGLVVDRATGRPFCVSTNKNIPYYRLPGRKAHIPEGRIHTAVCTWLQGIELTEAGIRATKHAIVEFMRTSSEERAASREEHSLTISQLDRQLEVAEMKLLDGIITDSRYRAILARIEQQRSGIFAEMPAQETRNIDVMLTTVGQFVELIKLLKKGYERLPPAGKVTFAKMVLSNVSVDGETLEIIGKKYTTALLNLSKSTNGRPLRDDCRTLVDSIEEIELVVERLGMIAKPLLSQGFTGAA